MSVHEEYENWDDFLKLSIDKRLERFQKDGRMIDLLFAQQFTKKFLDEIYVLTNKIRLISKSKEGEKFLKSLLMTKKVMLYFIQPSTRTYLSFYTACSNLGMSIADVRSSETSSEIKGESPEDTVRTFSSYFDLIIMRHPEEGFAEKAAHVLNHQSRRPIPIINAGSGKDQHPTQALLDIFTLKKTFNKIGGVDFKTVMFVGDLKRGRTVRSLVYLLTNYKGVKFIFCAPKGFEVENDVKEDLKTKGYTYIETSDMEKHLPEADAIYMTRLQNEYDKKGESNTYKTFSLNKSNIHLLKPTGCIMHPLPRREEISTEIDNDPRALYWRQMRNGMWTRTALIAYFFKVDDVILNY